MYSEARAHTMWSSCIVQPSLAHPNSIQYCNSYSISISVYVRAFVDLLYKLSGNQCPLSVRNASKAAATP
jgi:hypothetical protein